MSITVCTIMKKCKGNSLYEFYKQHGYDSWRSIIFDAFFLLYIKLRYYRLGKCIWMKTAKDVSDVRNQVLHKCHYNAILYVYNNLRNKWGHRKQKTRFKLISLFICHLEVGNTPTNTKNLQFAIRNHNLLPIYLVQAKNYMYGTTSRLVLYYS